MSLTIPVGTAPPPFHRFKGTTTTVTARGASGTSAASADGGAQQAAGAAVEEDASGGLSSMVRPMLPSRGRNTIDDDTFFDSLPEVSAWCLLVWAVWPCLDRWDMAV